MGGSRSQSGVRDAGLSRWTDILPGAHQDPEDRCRSDLLSMSDRLTKLTATIESKPARCPKLVPTASRITFGDYDNSVLRDWRSANEVDTLQVTA